MAITVSKTEYTADHFVVTLDDGEGHVRLCHHAKAPVVAEDKKKQLTQEQHEALVIDESFEIFEKELANIARDTAKHVGMTREANKKNLPR